MYISIVVYTYIISIKVVCISTRLLAEQNEVEHLGVSSLGRGAMAHPDFDRSLNPFSTRGRAQCVELNLRWQFCVHSSICPEIYLSSKFWRIFDILNTRSWLRFAQMHIWNIIEEIVFRNYNFLLLLETISSIMF